ncbi:MAG: translational GTPase TypA [Xylanivirga thermophila]|jgi:GTP-binding protein|uniref:translational GTPase TypA n=1 Tax=Xylanivirga thermophila TaxID=2496273 RepID=UPI00101D82EB|nr:translational GTPase TypA [Xylanivirga thermophila]
MNITRNDIRNIAIIAHVDHGKTTLVDQMLKKSGIFRANQQVEDRVMDSNELERERGITILSKNTSVWYKDVKINIIDTPGHADFGGEVERVLKMVDGVVLLVDAFEGPMPQTRFVLKKALELGLPVIVVINKMDKPDARPEEVIDEVLELLIDLDADESQLDCPFVFASSKQGLASLSADDLGKDLQPLFDTIVQHIPAPVGDKDAPFQMLVSTIDYNEYVGRIAIGEVGRGSVKLGQEAILCNMKGKEEKVQITNLYQFEGLKRVQVENATVGDIIAVSGVEGISIGDTICDVDHVEPLHFVHISEPTISMQFLVNNSPFAGQEGTYVTSRNLRDRLFKELKTDVSLRVEETDSPDTFNVSGRGELHLSILIETMRRQGYEFQVSKPTVIYKEIDGKKCEPMEKVMIDVPDEFTGTVIEKLGRRKGELLSMVNTKGGRVRLEFSIPSRGLFGYRSEFMTDTKGQGILNAIFDGYQPYKGEIPTRQQGALVAFESGESITYGLYNAQERGTLFIEPGTRVYQGMVVGRNSRPGDIDVNVCKKKHVSNMRAAGSDETLRLVTPRKLTLEEAIEFINDDELVEITPKSIRLRKSILDTAQRKKLQSKKA